MRLISAFLSLLFFVGTAHAATFISDAPTHLKLTETRELPLVTIMAQKDGEITVQNGINILLDTQVYILWNASTLTLTGSAVTNGKMNATVVPTYPNTYTVVHLPVLADFKAGEAFTIAGLGMRAYESTFGPRLLGLDYNGDFIADAEDVNGYSIQDFVATDHTPPYSPMDLTYKFNATHTALTLTWQDPPDYDFFGTDVERTVTRGGQTLPTEFLGGLLTTQTYLDTNIKIGDQITYSVFSRDRRNQSDPVTLKITVTPVPVPDTTNVDRVAEDKAAAQNNQTVVPSTVDVLTKRYGYYKARYQIKCMPSGNPVSYGDSACLWAKIDLVYVQTLIGRQDLSVSMTARDITLIGSRLVFSEKRYQANCVHAELPAAYCFSLNEALDRARYFLNR